LNTYSSDIQKLYESIDGNRSGEKIGMVSISFNRYVNSKDDKDVVVSILESVKTTLNAKGETIDIKELNQIEGRKSDEYFKNEWKKPIHVSSFLGGGRYYDKNSERGMAIENAFFLVQRI
jgi:hypothetical protein